jgi:hypothetical protein
MIKPLLTKPFLKFFKKLKTKNKTYLELGSGDSTLYFSKHFKRVVSLEDDRIWFDQLNNNKPKNVELHLFNKDNIGNILKTKLDEKPDYVMIDNNPQHISRLDIAKFVHFNKQNNCIIILDNGPENLKAFSFLRENYFNLDFVGKRYDNQTSTTSIFFTYRNSNLVL